MEKRVRERGGERKRGWKGRKRVGRRNRAKRGKGR